MKTQSTQRPLNSRQKHFLDRYHITGNLGQSWLDAGYNCSFESASGNAGRILQRDDAQEYLAELQQTTRQHTGLTREKILDRLEEIIDDRTAKNRDVIWACREANRMIGAYQPKPDPEPKVDPLQQFIARMRAGKPAEIGEFPQLGSPEPAVDESEPSVVENRPRPAEPETPRSENIVTEDLATETPAPVEPRRVENRRVENRRSPVQQPTRLEQKAARNAAMRDPDWHPLYNPHYDPTGQSQKRRVNVILPGRR